MRIDEVKRELFSLLMKLDSNNMSDIDVELLFQLSKDKAIQSNLNIKETLSIEKTYRRHFED